MGPARGSSETPTMKQLYDEHFLGVGRDGTTFTTPTLRRDVSKDAQERKKSIDRRFARVRNPLLLMYVFPRLNSEDNTPIPGYWTAFSMYLSDEYAMVGENTEYGAEE